jgi:hypothetical protein
MRKSVRPESAPFSQGPYRGAASEKIARPLEDGRCTSARRILGTHETDMVAVGILDDGVARTPEDVVRRLATGVAGSSQLGVTLVGAR